LTNHAFLFFFIVQLINRLRITALRTTPLRTTLQLTTLLRTTPLRTTPLRTTPLRISSARIAEGRSHTLIASVVDAVELCEWSTQGKYKVATEKCILVFIIICWMICF
jgi:hypothetical protein